MGSLFSLLGGALLDGALGVLKALIEFFKTPVGQVVGLGLLVIGAYVGGKVVEHHKLTVKHRAAIVALNAAWQQREEKAAAAYETSRQARDATITRDVREKVGGEIAEQKTRAEDLSRQLDLLKNERAQASGVYRLTADDIARIQRVRAARRK